MSMTILLRKDSFQTTLRNRSKESSFLRLKRIRRSVTIRNERSRTTLAIVTPKQNLAISSNPTNSSTRCTINLLTTLLLTIHSISSCSLCLTILLSLSMTRDSSSSSSSNHLLTTSNKTRTGKCNQSRTIRDIQVNSMVEDSLTKSRLEALDVEVGESSELWVRQEDMQLIN